MRANPAAVVFCDIQMPGQGGLWLAGVLRAEFPQEPERWRDLETACEMQGDNGCFATPVNVLPNVLSDDEQSIESPRVDLSQASGEVVLQFSYVPFNVGDTFALTVQGTAAYARGPVSGQQRSTTRSAVLARFCSASAAGRPTPECSRSSPGGWPTATAW